MLTLLRGRYRAASKEELEKVPVIRPQNAGSRWRGVAHFDFVNTALEVLHDLFNIVPHNPLYAVSPDNMTMIGGFELYEAVKKKGKRKPELSPILLSQGMNPDGSAGDETVASLGMRHSNNFSHALSWSAGGRVMICENGMVTGEYQDKRRHTKGLKLREWLSESLAGLMDWINKGKERVARLIDGLFMESHHAPTVLALNRAGVLPSRLIEFFDDLICRAFRSPDTLPPEVAPFHADDKGNLSSWSWYNLLTYTLKRTAIPRQQQSLLAGMNAAEYLLEHGKQALDVNNMTAAIKPNWEFA